MMVVHLVLQLHSSSRLARLLQCVSDVVRLEAGP